MATKCLLSALIDSDKSFIDIPLEANCFATKRNRCILSRSNPHLEEGYRIIPIGASRIRFPHFRRYYGWTDYGTPEFYDLNGNSIKP